MAKPTLITKPLEIADFKDGKKRSTPLPKLRRFDMDRSPPLPDNERELHASLIEDLQYLPDSTCLDIAFPTAKLAQHIRNQTKQPMQPLKHVLRYLKATRHQASYFRLPTMCPLNPLRMQILRSHLTANTLPADYTSALAPLLRGSPRSSR